MQRVLIICYYWPPAGGPGVQRWLKFVKYFQEFGISPVLYIPENPHYPIRDNSLALEVPRDIEIIKKPIREPYKIAKLFSKKKTKAMSSGVINEGKLSLLGRMMLYVRGNLFIPDARVGWVQPSVHYLNQYLKSNNDIDTIITSGPPHSLHLIGKALKKKRSIKWIADFRDPWTQIHYHASLRLTKRAQKRHQQLEKEVLEQANLITVTSPSTQKDFQKITSVPVELVTNGFDTEEIPPTSLDTTFSLVHIGSLLSDRNPAVLWKALASLCEENPSFKEQLEIKLVGVVSESVIKSISEYGLDSNLTLTGYVSHSKALEFQNAAQLLLLIEMDKPETRAIVPGKFFEYVSAKRPIIALGPQGSDIELLLEETQGGSFFDYTHEKELRVVLEQSFVLFQQNALVAQSKNIDQFHRKNLTQAYTRLIKSV